MHGQAYAAGGGVKVVCRSLTLLLALYSGVTVYHNNNLKNYLNRAYFKKRITEHHPPSKIDWK